MMEYRGGLLIDLFACTWFWIVDGCFDAFRWATYIIRMLILGVTPGISDLVWEEMASALSHY
uniref:Uncharacterized protein n=1 Tax=Arundo donax TaxID=35708 RepID=A0A0A9CUQ3_ARUDO